MSDLMNITEARTVWADIRAGYGFGPDATVIKVGGNAKLDKEMGKRPVVFGSHTLLSGRVNGTCVNDATCADDCVVGNGGRAGMPSVQRGRAALTELALNAPEAHAALLVRDIHAAGRKARRLGADLRIRLNTNSDLAWERTLPSVVWETVAEYGVAYDYTKRIDRVGWVVPGVYRTSYSATAHTRPAQVARLLGRGDTVTLVLPVPQGGSVPPVWAGMPMVSGDDTDDRSGDPSGSLVGLTAKGKLLQRWKRTGVWGPLVTSLAR